MSRVGNAPIPVPSGVQVTIKDNLVHVKGKLGELQQEIPEAIKVKLEHDILTVSRESDEKTKRALHGLSRALIANMVHGVSVGYSKDLEMVGVGYRCEMRGQALQLAVGFSHRVICIPPEGVTIKVNTNTTFTVSGIDKQLVGEMAANIRSVRPPEPYKGKGIKYVGEYVRRKAGKASTK